MAARSESVSFSSAQAEAVDITPEVDDTRDTVNSFMTKIAQAKSEGAESIETSQAVIDHYNRAGLNGSDYFIYDGIKVYPDGKTDEIETKSKMSMEEKHFKAKVK